MVVSTVFFWKCLAFKTWICFCLVDFYGFYHSKSPWITTNLGKMFFVLVLDIRILYANLMFIWYMLCLVHEWFTSNMQTYLPIQRFSYNQGLWLNRENRGLWLPWKCWSNMTPKGTSEGRNVCEDHGALDLLTLTCTFSYNKKDLAIHCSLSTVFFSIRFNIWNMNLYIYHKHQPNVWVHISLVPMDPVWIL